MSRLSIGPDRTRLTVVGVTIAAMLVMPVLVKGQASTTPNAAASKATAGSLPRTADGHPDMHGVWDKVGGDITEKNPPFTPLIQEEFHTFAYPTTFTAGGEGGPVRAERLKRRTGLVDPADQVLPWRPEADAARRAYLAKMNPPASIDYVQLSSRCSLGGGGGPFGGGTMRLLQRSDKILMQFERSNSYRSIPLDGRSHVGSNVRLFMGDSVGRWEGDTLVVDTTNLNGKIEFGVYTYFPYFSDALHTVERYTPVDANTIDFEITYNDPKLFTKAIVSAGYLMRAEKGMDLIEYACAEGGGSHTLPNMFGF